MQTLNGTTDVAWMCDAIRTRDRSDPMTWNYLFQACFDRCYKCRHSTPQTISGRFFVMLPDGTTVFAQDAATKLREFVEVSCRPGGGSFGGGCGCPLMAAAAAASAAASPQKPLPM